MSNTKHFTDSLSAYIDGALNPVERARVDAHLATCPQCRADLNELRYVAQMTRALPLVRAPRSFTLSPEMVARTARPWQFGWLYASLRGMTAVAAVLLVFVCSADFLSGSRLGGSGAAAPVPSVLNLPANTPVNSGVAADQATNQSKSPATAAPAAPAGAAPAATAAPLPSQTAHPALPAQAAAGTESPTTRAAGVTTGTPAGATRSAAAAATATAGPTTIVTEAPAASTSSPLTVTSPVFPTVPLPVPPNASEGPSQTLPFRPAEIGLLGALLVGGVGAFILRATRR